MKDITMERTSSSEQQTTMIAPLAIGAISFQALKGTRTILAGGDAAGRETPDSRLWLSVRAERLDRGVPTNEVVDIQICLTIRQVAWIVKQFLRDVVRKWDPMKKDFRISVHGHFLRRLLLKRWAVMTSSVYKDEAFRGPEFGPQAEHHANPVEF